MGSRKIVISITCYACHPTQQRHCTVEEYFAFEEQSDIRHEYYHGELFPLNEL